jgi:hypothetical protein
MLFNGPCVHQFVAHREVMPCAKTVGVAHSSCQPTHVSRFIITLEFFTVFSDGRILFFH